MPERSTRRALLDAVLAEPDDDVRRLIFADFLEEEGDAGDRAWAGVIRNQLNDDEHVCNDPNVVLGSLHAFCPWFPDGRLATCHRLYRRPEEAKKPDGTFLPSMEANYRFGEPWGVQAIGNTCMLTFRKGFIEAVWVRKSAVFRRIAGRLALEHPLRSFAVKTGGPGWYPYAEGKPHYWMRKSSASAEHLPQWLFDRLDGHAPDPDLGGGWQLTGRVLCYDSIAAANKALSEAAIEFAYEQADHLLGRHTPPTIAGRTA